MLILKLPNWVLVNKFPAKFDDESLTVLEQTARLYAKVNELIDSYNKYVEEINKTISDYQNKKDSDVDAFLCSIKCLTDNYINTVDMKISHQDRQIAEIYAQFKDDVLNTIKLMLSDLKQSGELDNAILTALDGINSKVDNFIVEMNNKQAELETDYTEKKTALETDYQNTKTALGEDYTEKKTALETDYQNTKTALNGDYTEKKTALETDYQNTKTALNSDYTEKKTELQNSVAGYVDMYDDRNAPVYEGDPIPAGDLSTPIAVPDLYKYQIVSVDCGTTRVLCRLSANNDDVYISGVGNPCNSSTGMSTTAIFLGVVQIKCTFVEDGYKIVSNNSYVINLQPENEQPVRINSQVIYNIKGIV